MTRRQNLYAITFVTVDRCEWAAIQASFHLSEDGSQFLKRKPYGPYDPFQMCLNTFDSRFPQPTEVWGVLRDKLPFDVSHRTKLRNDALTRSISEKLVKFLEFTICTHEVRAVITP